MSRKILRRASEKHRFSTGTWARAATTPPSIGAYIARDRISYAGDGTISAAREAWVYALGIVSAYRILLFDIDGTLVSTGGAGAIAWKRAFEELHGIPADIGEYTEAGMTDPDVGAKTFEAVLQRKPTPHELAQLIQRRLEHLPEAVAESRGYRVLPGVPERLRQLSRDGHLLGIITGNGDGAAHIKLQRGDLNRWFTFGAYASAGLERADIVREAVHRAEAMLEQDFPNEEIYVIGDTPLDIQAAHAAGCTAVAVATGHYDRAGLKEAGADHVLETLDEALPLK